MGKVSYRLITLLLSLRSAIANYGDYVDLTFTCPVTTTCPELCVATADDCPVEMQCSNNMTLCADGSCAVFCDPDLVSPCSSYSACAPVTCQKIVATYDVCQSFATLYDFASTCDLSTVTTDTDDSSSYGATLSWTDPAYILSYVWISCVTFGIFAWCWFNHLICPVHEATTLLQKTGEHEREQSISFQTGCKRHLVGQILFALTVLTFLAWSVLLAIISSLFYTYQSDEDVVMLLKTFYVTWNMAILWSLILRWPVSIGSIFLRRCKLSEATHIAVLHQRVVSVRNEVLDSDSIFPKTLKKIADRVFRFVRISMTFLYADPDVRPDRNQGILEYCPVRYNADGSRYFVFLFRRYNFDEKQQKFVQGAWNVGVTFAEIAPKGIVTLDDFEVAYEKAIREHDSEQPESASYSRLPEKIDRFRYRVDARGLSNQDVAERESSVGPNQIEMTKPSFLKSLQSEITKPFYMYQYYILWPWMTIQYWYMSCVNWSIIWIAACTVSWFRYRGAKVLYGISKVDGETTVLRNDAFVTIRQTELVPGDIVLLSPGVTHCDLVLLTGETVVDESALTGEATPQPKIPIDPGSDAVYDTKEHKRHTIFAGTKIFECESALAIVTSTASYTAKGELLREIISFRQHVPKYEEELPAVVGILCTCCLIYFLLTFFSSDAALVISWNLAMCAVCITFPALLPVTFTVPGGVSMNRLAKAQIACTSSDSILIAGKVTKVFFDKTGTLTMQDLDYVSSRSADSWDSGQWTSEALAMAMATCHSLTKSRGGKLLGNPLDRAMFLASHAKLVNVSGVSADIKDQAGTKYHVVRRFDFDHHTMTQSVIVRMRANSLVVYVKGSGENVSRLCSKESIPGSYYSKLTAYNRSGFYQIAVATKSIPADTDVSTMTRKEVEANLEFVGVLNFSNRLRRQTPEVIEELTAAGIQSVMVTGDNLYTGVYIARMSRIIPATSSVIFGLLDGSHKVIWLDEYEKPVPTPCPDTIESSNDDPELAMSGEAWQELLAREQEYAIRLAPYIRVFGRCSPHDKVSVVDTFAKNMRVVTLMCGDGGNDCGALKTAHIGLALSDSDASLVASFTSLQKDIGSVLTILKEGRGALASTMAAYKYVVTYGQINSYTPFILYKLSVSFSDWMWTFIDGVWTITFSLTLPLALPAKTLAMARPTASLLGRQTISSVTGIVLLQFIFMAIAYTSLTHQDWYQCRKWGENSLSTGYVFSYSDNYEAEVIFLVCGFQLISSAITYNFGYEFRRNGFRNWVFVLFASAFTFMQFYITLVPGKLSCFWRVNCVNDYVVRGVITPDPSPIGNPFNSTVMPVEFRWTLACIMMGNGLAVAAYDYFVVNGLRRRYEARKICNQNNPQSLEHQQEQRIRQDSVKDSDSSAQLAV